jgi:hypothetical protein
MWQSYLVGRGVAVIAFGAGITVFTASVASAAYDKGACLRGYRAMKEAREFEKAGRLREAGESFATCAQLACGGWAQKCAARREDIVSQTPSIIPLVTDEAGVPRVDVQVKIDGAVVASQLDGRGLPVEPGLHEVSFSTSGVVFASEKVMVVEGQRNRPVAVTMHAQAKVEVASAAMQAANTPASATAESVPVTKPVAEERAQDPSAGGPVAESPSRKVPLQTKSGLSAVPYVLGGVAAAGVGAGALLTLWGNRDNAALSQCAPHCLQSSVDHIRGLYIAADVSVGVGAVALGAATWIFVRHSLAKESSPPGAAYRFDVSPTPHGAFAAVTRSF